MSGRMPESDLEYLRENGVEYPWGARQTLRVMRERDESRRQLRIYGDHLFKCAVRRQLRENALITVECDCGWWEIAKEMK